MNYKSYFEVFRLEVVKSRFKPVTEVPFYPIFRLHTLLDCFWCEIVKDGLVLKEHETARWLTREQLDEVEWLPADVTLIEKVGDEMGLL